MLRRDFLDLSAKSLSLLVLSELSFLRQAMALEDSELAPQYFVQITLKYGWDVTLGIDPWLGPKPDDKEMFIEYDPSNILRAGGVAFGPSMLPMKDYASQMAVINGVFISEVDNGHEAAESYMLSGSVSQNWGSLPVEFSECRGENFLGILTRGRLGTGLRSPGVTTLDSVASLINSDAGPGFSSAQDGSNRLSRIQGDVSRFSDNFKKMRELAAEFRKTSPNLTSAHYMAAAMASGLSQTAFYSSEGPNSLDTHANHPGSHQAFQLNRWEDVKTLLDIFRATPLGSKGERLFDRTTFFITSEFSRTAALNASQGKDHNPLTNSVLLIGPNIKGNVTIGGSHLVPSRDSKTGSSYHIASPVNWATGQALSSKENAHIIKPDNVAATLIEALGISRRRFASVLPTTPSLFHLLKKS